MARRLIECVPNFSEGRDPVKVATLAETICSVAGVVMLDQEMDSDHNRSVLTFAGPPESVSEAAIRAAGKAVELIDLTAHTGVHPRIGAVDVIPFVPVEGVTLEDCVHIAERVGEEIWRRHKVPVYLYEAAARRPDRINLENIRRGQFEGLRDEVLTNPDRAPDIGDAHLHPTGGATVVGARKFLIAYNINLGTPDVEIAKRIAKAIRFSSGGFRFVKAMGVSLGSRNLAQVSMNLTDFEQTPVHLVFETVQALARRYGVEVVGSEIVGLIPKRALELTSEFFLRCENFRPELILENRLSQSWESETGLDQFLEKLASPLPTPGGGSAAAAAGSMAAALGAMVSQLAARNEPEYEIDRRFLAAAVERDANAFKAVMAAYQIPKAERGPFVEEALQRAATVPMEVAERSLGVRLRLEVLARETSAKFSSDVETGRALAAAAITGALANVRINLKGIKDPEFLKSIEERLRAVEG